MKRNSSSESRDSSTLWTHKGNKFVIGTLHGDVLEITAQYNPKELSRSASATWTAHPNTSAKQSPSHDTHIWMEYGTTEPRTLTFELLFDGYEEGISVARFVEQLESLTLPKDMSSKFASERRPRACVAVWGSQSLRCVVMSVATKLTMFDSSGEPLRAICTVTVKETDVVQMMKADKDTSDFKSREDQLAAHSNVDPHKTRQRVNDKPVAETRMSSRASSAPAAKPAPASVAKTAPAAQPAPGAKPTTFEPGTSQTPAGNYETGEKSTPTDANQIEGSDPAKPTAFEPGTSKTPAATYETGTARTPASESANEIEGSKSSFTPHDDLDHAGDRKLPSPAPAPTNSQPIVVPKNYKPPTDLE